MLRSTLGYVTDRSFDPRCSTFTLPLVPYVYVDSFTPRLHCWSTIGIPDSLPVRSLRYYIYTTFPLRLLLLVTLPDYRYVASHVSCILTHVYVIRCWVIYVDSPGFHAVYDLLHSAVPSHLMMYGTFVDRCSHRGDPVTYHVPRLFWCSHIHVHLRLRVATRSRCCYGILPVTLLPLVNLRCCTTLFVYTLLCPLLKDYGPTIVHVGLRLLPHRCLPSLPTPHTVTTILDGRSRSRVRITFTGGLTTHGTLPFTDRYRCHVPTYVDAVISTPTPRC